MADDVWTEQQKAYLLAERAKGTPVPLIAAALGKRIPATYTRCRMLGNRVQVHTPWTADLEARLRDLATGSTPMSDQELATRSERPWRRCVEARRPRARRSPDETSETDRGRRPRTRSVAAATQRQPPLGRPGSPPERRRGSRASKKPRRARARSASARPLRARPPGSSVRSRQGRGRGRAQRADAARCTSCVQQERA